MTTAILPSTGLTSLLGDKIVFVDTNVFIGASLCDEFAVFLADLRTLHKSQILTVSSVVYEFTRGSKALDEFNIRREFVSDLTDRIISVGRLMENPGNDVFSLVMSRLVSSKDSGYTDFLLATCLYQYSAVEEIYLMTADQKSMPRAIFDIVGTVTVANVKAFHNYGIYKLNRYNFTEAAANQPKRVGA